MLRSDLVNKIVQHNASLGGNLGIMESFSFQDWTRIGAMNLVGVVAGFQTCCVADFQIRSAVEFGWLADLEIRDRGQRGGARRSRNQRSAAFTPLHRTKFPSL